MDVIWCVEKLCSVHYDYGELQYDNMNLEFIVYGAIICVSK